MARRKRKTPVRVVAGLSLIPRQNDVLEPVYEADPDGRPVVHHRTVDTLGIMLRAGTVSKDMHDAARDFQAQFTIARFDVVRCMPLIRLPENGGPADLTDAQVHARRRVGRALDAWAGSAVRPAAVSGMSSACSAPCASGRCARAGVAGQSTRSTPRASSSQRWMFWQGIMATGHADGEHPVGDRNFPGSVISSFSRASVRNGAHRDQ